MVRIRAKITSCPFFQFLSVPGVRNLPDSPENPPIQTLNLLFENELEQRNFDPERPGVQILTCFKLRTGLVALDIPLEPPLSFFSLKFTLITRLGYQGFSVRAGAVGRLARCQFKSVARIPHFEYQNNHNIIEKLRL